MNYRIWSIEHNAWWGPNECGYTPKKADAGLYEPERAHQIAAGANRHPRNSQKPNEALVPVED